MRHDGRCHKRNPSALAASGTSVEANLAQVVACVCDSLTQLAGPGPDRPFRYLWSNPSHRFLCGIQLGGKSELHKTAFLKRRNGLWNIDRVRQSPVHDKSSCVIALDFHQRTIPGYVPLVDLSVDCGEPWLLYEIVLVIIPLDPNDRVACNQVSRFEGSQM